MWSQATQQLVDFFPKGIAPPQGTFDYNTAPDAFIAGRLATYSSDLTIAAVLMGKPNPPAFEWAVLPYPPGSRRRVNFNDIGLYAMSSKTPNKDLAWEVLEVVDERRAGRLLDGRLRHLSGAHRRRGDGIRRRTARRSSPPRSTCSRSTASGPEPFAQWGTIESSGGSAGGPRLQRRDLGRGGGREHRADRAAGGLRLIARQVERCSGCR